MGKLLQLKEIHKSFGDQHIHRGISIDLHKNECLGLLGPSGTGKSVLLKSIIGLSTIDSGEIIYKNQNLENLSEHEYGAYRKLISYCFQNGALFDSETVFENIAFPLRQHLQLDESEIQKKVNEVLKLVNLENTHSLMPSDLSGGMIKRVGMARSMMLDPEIVLFDEPTAGLDPENTLKIIDAIDTFKKEANLTSIFVTHDIPAAIKLCDRIVVIEEGKVIFNGNPSEVKSVPFIKSFYEYAD